MTHSKHSWSLLNTNSKFKSNRSNWMGGGGFCNFLVLFKTQHHPSALMSTHKWTKWICWVSPTSCGWNWSYFSCSISCPTTFLAFYLWDGCLCYQLYAIPNKLQYIPLQSCVQSYPNFSFVWVFGCRCYPHLPPYNKHKMDFRSISCVSWLYHFTSWVPLLRSLVWMVVHYSTCLISWAILPVPHCSSYNITDANNKFLCLLLPYTTTHYRWSKYHYSTHTNTTTN